MNVSPVCVDKCPYCSYIGEGDFACVIANSVTISNWEPKRCVCPKKRSVINEQNSDN